MSYTLTARQKLAYTDRFDIYRQADWENKDNDFKEDVVYNSTPVASSVRCLWMNHPDINSPVPPLGIMLMESTDVLDVINFPLGVGIKSGDALHLKTPGHPQRGEWFIVMGFGAARQSRGNRAGNYVQVRAKRMLAPAGLEGITV